jgi:hypothetical protein
MKTIATQMVGISILDFRASLISVKEDGKTPFMISAYSSPDA